MRWEGKLQKALPDHSVKNWRKKTLTKDRKKSGHQVNPGFYFQSVTYNQTTSVITKLNGDLGPKSRAIKRLLEPKVPGLTDNGLAAMLGNCNLKVQYHSNRDEGDPS